MQFGTPVLSSNRSLHFTHERVNGKFLEIAVVKTGMYLFERPDNGKCIIEIDGSLLHDDLKNVLYVNDVSIDYFKTAICNHYERKLNHVNTQLKEALQQKKQDKVKADEFQQNIDAVERKNEVEFSENRAKSIRQQAKALRKYQHRLEAIQRTTTALEEKVANYEDSKEASLQKLVQDMKPYL